MRQAFANGECSEAAEGHDDVLIQRTLPMWRKCPHVKLSGGGGTEGRDDEGRRYRFAQRSLAS